MAYIKEELRLALGTVQFGMDYGINNNTGKVPKEEVCKILEESLNSGIDIIDTAYIYGCSERVIGDILENNSISFKVISKLPFCDGINADHLYFMESLKRLKLSRLYGYLVHDFNVFIQNPAIWETLERLKNEGKVDKVGFSLYRPEELLFLIERNIHIDLVQIPFNIFDQRFAKLFPILKENNVEIHVRSVFLQGLFFKRPGELRGYLSKVDDKLSALHSFAQEKMIPISAICLNFAHYYREVDRIVIGVDCLEHLKENIMFLNYKEQFNELYDKLLSLREDDENIILPSNWSKDINKFKRQ
jgi:aryl-alcohol dehydrogenase-like predicted oxidoreductase